MFDFIQMHVCIFNYYYYQWISLKCLWIRPAKSEGKTFSSLTGRRATALLKRNLIVMYGKNIFLWDFVYRKTLIKLKSVLWRKRARLIPHRKQLPSLSVHWLELKKNNRISPKYNFSKNTIFVTNFGKVSWKQMLRMQNDRNFALQSSPMYVSTSLS